MIPKKPDDETEFDVTPVEDVDDSELGPDEEIVEDEEDEDDDDDDE
jgi:hypothetical protein